MTRLEQAAPMEATPAAGVGGAAEPIVPSRSEINEARATSTGAAQTTVDERFGSPEIEGLNSNPPGETGAEGGTSSDASLPKPIEGDAEAGTSTDASQPQLEEKPQLSSQDLEVAASFGRLGETLTKAGVDVNDQQAVDDYLGRAFDSHVALGLRLAGVPLPPKPTDADMGNAIKPFVAQSNDPALLEKIERNPAEGYAYTRERYQTMLNGYLKQEREQPKQPQQ